MNTDHVDTYVALIDTTKTKLVRVGLRINTHEVWNEEVVDIFGPQRVLPMLIDLLSAQKLTLKDLQHIEVNKGPGSFTGLRVGFAVANSLGYLLGIKVNDSPVGQSALPIYETAE